MADRYLLESGAPDGYQLEDGSGVLILEQQPTITKGTVFRGMVIRSALVLIHVLAGLVGY